MWQNLSYLENKDLSTANFRQVKIEWSDIRVINLVHRLAVLVLETSYKIKTF